MRTGAVTLTIDSHLDHVFLVGVAVNRICAAVDLGEQVAGEVEAAVVEAVNNAIEHAYANRPGHRVDVRVRLESDGVFVQVCDDGRAIPAETWRAAAAEPERLAERGRGMMIMRGFMDDVQYAREAGRNVVTMIKRIPAGAT